MQASIELKLPKYPLASGDKLLTSEFISEGPKGLIHKMVRYQHTNIKGVYNLAFGDKTTHQEKLTIQLFQTTAIA